MKLENSPLTGKHLEQSSLEDKMVDDGRSIFYDSLREYSRRGIESRSPYGIILMKDFVDAVANGVERKFVGDAKFLPSRKVCCDVAVSYFEDVRVIAYLSLKCVIDTIGSKISYVALCKRISTCIFDQINFSKMAKLSPAELATIKSVSNKRTHAGIYSSKRRAIRNAMERAGISRVITGTTKQKIGLGAELLSIIIERTGIVEIGSFPAGAWNRQGQICIMTSPMATDLIDAINKRCEELANKWYPMVVVPLDRVVGQRSGGYIYSMKNKVKIVKARNSCGGGSRESLNSELEIRAINALQGTRWRVNKDILKIMSEAWDTNHPEKYHLPTKTNLAVSGKEEKRKIFKEFKADPESIKNYREWRENQFQVYTFNRDETIKRTVFLRTLSIAKHLENQESLYFVYSNDFRGRKYPCGSILTPHDKDSGRALLEFGESKPLGENGMQWLCSHGANCFGLKGASYSARCEWVNKNDRDIIRSAENPLENEFWREAKDPWRFLAFCLEWLKIGSGSKESRIPVGIDGTSNGMQHLTAIRRDEHAAMFVNIEPGETPIDLYECISDRVKARLLKEQSKEILAQRWLDYGKVDRALVKRPIMVLPYGAREFSMCAMLSEIVKNDIGNIADDPFQGKLLLASNYMVKLILDEVKGILAPSLEVLEWLRSLALTVAKEGKTLSWVTPTGFHVHNFYTQPRRHTIRTIIDGVLHTPRYFEFKDEDPIDKAKVTNSISANLIHSMDAASLTLAVNGSLDLGVDTFSTIHDTYATHAVDVGKLSIATRNSFADMYSNYDPLEVIAKSSGVSDLKALPKGKFDINRVRESKYFFN